MSNSVPILIGARYSRGRNRNRFGSIVGLFSFLGMAIGVCALILVLSVMNGFNQEISGRLQTLSPHVTLTASNASADFEKADSYLSEGNLPVLAKSPVIESFAMLRTGFSQRPMKMIGIDQLTDSSVVGLSDQLVDGEVEDLGPGTYGIILGEFAANSLGVRVSETVTVTLPKLRMTPVGLFPRQKQFQVVGVFESGSQLDSEIVYAHYQDMAKVLGVSSDDHGWRIRLEDVDTADAVAQKLNLELNQSGFSSKTWAGDYESLFKAMKMEKVTVGVLLMVIVLVAAFNIVSGLIMMVSDKRSEMAVLRTMGAQPSLVVKIFVVQGLILGLAGIFVGAVLGTLLAFNLAQIVAWFERLTGGHVFDPSVYYVSFLPSEWRFRDLVWVVGCASLMSLVATLIPALQASKISPREALNYKQ